MKRGEDVYLELLNSVNPAVGHVCGFNGNYPSAHRVFMLCPCLSLDPGDIPSPLDPGDLDPGDLVQSRREKSSHGASPQHHPLSP